MDEQARRATPPKRVRHPAGCSFASGCSPPRLATTQLPSATCVTTSHRSDFHLPDKTTSRTHSPAGLTRRSMDRRAAHGCPARSMLVTPPLQDEASALGPAGVRLAGRVGVEDQIGLTRFKLGRGSSHQLANGATLHEVGLDQAGEDERAFDAAVGFVSQAQQHEGDERDDDLGAHRVRGGSEEVADPEGLFDRPKNSLMPSGACKGRRSPAHSPSGRW